MRFSCLAGSRQRKSFGNFLQSAIVATFAAWIIISGFAKGDDCRNIHFKEKIENMALTEHVIKSDRVLGEEICRINCYVEPNCASYNYGPVENELHLCELNDKNHLQVPSDELEARNGFIYRLVFPTSCLSNPCPSNSTCQTGYGDQGYRCVCPYGYHGDKCQLDIEECVSGSHNCSPNAICMDIPGSFQCNCTSGYTGDGVNCKAEVLACASVTQLEGSNIYEVNADHGSWPADGFCRVFSKVEINAGDSYTMTVELMNVIGWLGVNSGHLGVFYNAVDENNFDLIYFRPNNIHRCYQPGHFLNGVFMRSVEGPCPNHPRGGVWLTLRVEVSSDQSVNIFLNNDLVTSLTAHFNTKGRGGVLVANGFQNIVQFREFDITAAL